MSFRSLNAFVAGVTARHFSPDAEGATLRAWFPPDPDAFPETRAGYTYQVEHSIHRGPARHKTRDLLGNLIESENRYSIHLLLAPLPAGIPYLPIKDRTTFLLGTTLATATPHRITEFQDLAGRLELQTEEFTLPY